MIDFSDPTQKITCRPSYIEVRAACKTCRRFPNCLVTRAAFGKGVCARDSENSTNDSRAPRKDDTTDD